MTPEFLIALVEVIWINILLSGDNAVVIALACQGLPGRQKHIGIILGSGAAIALRLIFSFMVTWLLSVPYLQAVGGVLLVYIAVQLATSSSDDHSVNAHDSLWRAIATIAVADAAMSLDNVVAIAAVARGDYALFTIGLVLSIPLIVVGATLISSILSRYPLLVWAGAALLGWVAGEMVGDDPVLLAAAGLPHNSQIHYSAAVMGVIAVIAISYVLKKRDKPVPIQ